MNKAWCFSVPVFSLVLALGVSAPLTIAEGVSTELLPDTTAPTGTITLNGGASYTNTRSVTLTISADDLSGVSEMNIANHTAYHGWEPYVTSKAWTLSPGEGLKYIRVKFRDAAGNETATGIPSSITVDTIAPVISLTGAVEESIIYGDAYIESGATTDDGSVVQVSNTVGTDVGDYTIDYDAVDAAGNPAVQVSRIVHVTPAAIQADRAIVTVTADPQTKVYGASDPVLTYVASDPAVITGTLGRASGENMGDYAIVQGTIATDANHVIDFTGNVLSIVLSATQSVPADDGSATVGSGHSEVVVIDQDQALTLTVNNDVADPTVNFDSLITDGTGTLPQTIISSTIGTVAVAVEIPDDTLVTASDSSWRGSMALPQADSAPSGDAPAGFSVGNLKIEVGSPDVTLLFDRAVKITLAGVTGVVGYRPAGSAEWQKITTQCTSATDHSNISAPGECYFQEGGNTTIWTYHFTTFGGLNPAVPVISPNGTVFSGSVDVTMDAVPGTDIHYTTDGTAPTCSSTLYSGTLTFHSPTVLGAVRCDGTNVSGVATATFVLVSNSGGGGGGSSVVVVTPTAPATLATSTAPVRGKVLGAAITPETALPSRLTFSQVASITALLTAFGVDDATVDGARVTLMK